MLRIYHYLAISSAILMCAALVLAAFFYHRQASADLVDLTTRQNVVVDRILTNSILSRYGDYLSRAAELDGDALRAQPETAKLDGMVRTIIHGASILKVKIYSAKGVTLYSTDRHDIGDNHSESPGFRSATEERRPKSKLSYRDTFTAFSGENFERDAVETYLPKFDADGNLTTVFELYADVTEATGRIDRSMICLSIGLTVIFALVYAILVTGIMRRAIAPIRLASQRAAQIGPHMPGVRLPTARMPREIMPLVQAINAALDRLDNALDAQRRFTADAAHELLTPLAVMRAHIDGMDDEEAARPLRQDVDGMTELVRQLLDIAELEAMAEAAEAVPETDLREVATDVVAQLAPLALGGGKEIALSGAPGPIPVQGCPRMLNRALRNLIENGLRHTPEGTTVEVVLEADGSVRVLDRGTGVPVPQRRTIFQRFWRGEKRSQLGAGLGLSIVKRIVEQMGGEIWVEDGPGGGACFVVRLSPVRPAPAAGGA